MPHAKLNFRDLGGIPAAEGRIRSGVIFRSEGPRNFNAEQQQGLRDINFRAIIDLRSSQEREEAPHEWHTPDCTWHALDVAADIRVFGNDGRERLMQGAGEELALSIMEDTYREIATAMHPHLAPIAAVISGRQVPALLNCTAGKDRTGAAAALLLEIAGVPREEILRDYLRSHIFASNLVESGDLEKGLMGSFGFLPSDAQVAALIGVRTEYLEAFWDEIDRRWSGVTAYFSDAGVDEDAQRTIRDILVEPA